MPQPANPYQVSGAQTTSNIDTALANARLGAVNQVTPYGTVTYSFGTPGGGAGAAAGGGAGAGGAGGGTAAAAPPQLQWENHVRSMLGLQPLVPGTPQYQQWLMNQQRQPYGGAGAAQGGVGNAGPPSGGIGGGGGAFAGGGGAGDPGAGSHGGQPTM